MNHHKRLLIILVVLAGVGIWFYANATTSGPNSPGTMADDATVGTVAWTTPDNAKVSDDVYASAVVPANSSTHYLKASNFGFSIPTGATISGIVMEVERHVDSIIFADKINGGGVRIVKSDGSISTTNKGTLSGWSTSDAYVQYGDVTDLWGETWTTTDINSSNFGVVMSGGTNSFGGRTAFIDHIRITVYYTPAAAGSPVQRQIRVGGFSH